MRRRRLLHAAGCAALFPAALTRPQAAPSQGEASAAWPAASRVRLIAAGSAGGSADVVARALADALMRRSGRTVIVDPKPGAAGVLAVSDLTQSPADGNTLLVAVNSLVSEIPHALTAAATLGERIRPVAELARGGLVMVGNDKLPARTLADVIAYAKSRAGTVSYASYSPGTLSHVMGLQLNQAAGIDMVHVGYKGSTAALQDVMGGHVPLMFDGMATSVPLIRSGKLKAFAVSTPQRSPFLPDVPTFAELGYPQLQAVAWMGLWASPNVPAATRAQIGEAVRQALAEPALQHQLRKLFFEVGQPRSAEALSATLEADSAKFGAMLKSIGFKPQ